MKRNTVQNRLVLEAVRSMCTHPTAEDIYESVVFRCPTISRGTVYRNLNTLADEGLIRRVAVPDAPDRYDKTVFSHSHFKCKSCGRVFDLSLKKDITADDLQASDFDVTDYDLVFHGRCNECKEDINGQ